MRVPWTEFIAIDNQKDLENMTYKGSLLLQRSCKAKKD